MPIFFRTRAMLVICCMLQPTLSAMDYDQMQERIREDRAENCAACSCLTTGVGSGIGFGYLVNATMAGAAPALTGITVTTSFVMSGIIFGIAGGFAGYKLIKYCDGGNDDENQPLV